VEALAGAIRDLGGDIFLGNRVLRLEVQGDRVKGVGVSGMSFPFDAVVAAIPSPAFLALGPPLPDDYRRRLESIPYLSALCLVLVLSRPFTPFYWLNIGSRSIPFVAAVEHTNLVPDLRYGGKRILYISNYLSPQSALYSMDAGELLEHYLPHLRHINTGFDPGWVEEYHLFREEAAQPVVTTGYGARVPPLGTPVEGLYLANTTQIYPEDRGMNYSVRLGLRVSQMVLEEWKGDIGDNH
jgi:protoporphyrinogen oxidase